MVPHGKHGHGPLAVGGDGGGRNYCHSQRRKMREKEKGTSPLAALFATFIAKEKTQGWEPHR